jgi:hypothetical protein
MLKNKQKAPHRVAIDNHIHAGLLRQASASPALQRCVPRARQLPRLNWTLTLENRWKKAEIPSDWHVQHDAISGPHKTAPRQSALDARVQHHQLIRDIEAGWLAVG